MPSFLSMQARWEVIQHLSPRYQQAPRAQKTRLLNECVSVTGYVRKYALRLLNHPEEAKPQPQRACLYGETVLNALLAVWTAANHICAKRLMPFLSTFLEALERHGHLHLSQEHRDQLLTMSVATADRFLRAQPKPQPRGLSCTKAGIVNLTRKMKSIAEVWRRKMLMGHGKWGDTYGYATRFAPVTRIPCLKSVL